MVEEPDGKRRRSLQESIAEMRGYIRVDVAGGFTAPAEIVDDVVSLLADDQDPAILRPIAEELTAHALTAHLESQASWPAISDCDRLDATFADLEARGIVSRQHFSCCGACGGGEMRDEVDRLRSADALIRGYSFYTVQDTESAVNGDGLWLNYGAAEDPENEAASLRIGHEIEDVLRLHGLTIEWNGSLMTRIHVILDWKRRRPVDSTVPNPR